MRWTERALVGSVGMFGAGSALALLVHLAPEGFERAPTGSAARVSLWATDRDADLVIGFDEDLLRTVEVAVPAPLEVEARGDGGAWVLSATERTPLGARSLIRISAGGELVQQASLGPCLDLSTLGGDDALAIEFAGAEHGATRAVRVRADSAIEVLFEYPGLMRGVGSRTHAWLGADDGRIVKLALEGGAVIEAEAELQGPVGDLALGPHEGWLWALELGSPRRVAVLDRDLRIAWRGEAGVNAVHLAPSADRARVWLFDPMIPRVRCISDAGGVTAERQAMRLSGIERAAAWRSDGALFATPGAILHTDCQGRSRPGQGGFRYLTDLASVWRPAP